MSLANRWPPSVEHIREALFASAIRQPARTLIVPIREAETGRGTVSYAADLARRLQARVRILHLRAPELQGAADDLLMVDDGQRLVFRLRSAEFVEASARQYSEASGVDISIRTRIGSHLASTVDEECRAGSEIVVFRRADRPAWRPAWMDRELNDLLHVSAPVLILPPAAEALAAPGAGKQRVLIPFGEGEATADVVRRAMDFAGASAHYDLVSILPMRLLESFHPVGVRRSVAQTATADVRNQAWFSLRQAREQLEQYGASVDAKLVFESIAAGQGILSQAVARRADLIVLGRQPPGLFPWTHCAWKHVARNAHVPVLLCPGFRS